MSAVEATLGATAPAAGASATSPWRPVVVAAVLFGMYAAFGAAWIGVVPLFPEVRAALSATPGEASWLVSVVSLAKSVFPILAGVAAARWGLTSTLRTAALLIALSIAVPFLPSFWAWIVGRFVFGVGGALWVTLMPAVVMQVFPAERRPLVNALNGVAVNTGVIVALKASLPLAAEVGWRGALATYGAVTGVFVVALFALGAIGPAPRAPAPATGATATAKRLRYVDVLKSPVTWVVSCAFTGPLALYLVLNTFLPSYFQTTYAMTRQEGADLLSWMNLWGIPASIATGLLVQRFGRAKPFLVVGSLLLPACVALSTVASLRPLLGVLLAGAGVGLFVTVAPLVTLLQSQRGMTPATIGMVLGTMFSLTYVLSSATPGVVGFLVDGGFAVGPLLVACAALGFTPAIGLFLDEVRRR